ncbi:hypothetical protein MAIT1_04513 [Magnetofaba australis IT-1]|uniref:Uncharacterized protein n=1 Tax=Magnetofaba australis IT-1 TaxID=1434232 RepID=A0A1Y2K9V6_9PROT|nr:hypothetical protein MAIT1_04513 [Magnetofaba australis IT-1]
MGGVEGRQRFAVAPTLRRGTPSAKAWRRCYWRGWAWIRRAGRRPGRRLPATARRRPDPAAATRRRRWRPPGGRRRAERDFPASPAQRVYAARAARWRNVCRKTWRHLKLGPKRQPDIDRRLLLTWHNN